VRTIIVHYHIFKNAGCSVDRILEMSFGDRWTTFEGATATSLLRPHDLSLFVKDRPEVLAISSHLLRPPAPADLDVLPVVLVRHPLDRAFSVYSQLRRNNGVLVSETVARESGFSDFVLWCLNHKPLGGVVIADYQVIHLSRASFRSEHIYNAVAVEDDLRDVIDYLAGVACFGTVDCLETTMARLRRVAEGINLHLSTAEVAENRTIGRPDDLVERLSIAQRQLGPALYDRYMQENELDWRLYEWASCHQADARLNVSRDGGGQLEESASYTGLF
jgi:hypothetical protein